MQRLRRSVASLMVLGLAWTVQAVPVLPESLIVTQENFDLGKFMGKWYELAVVSTCPYYMQRKSRNPVTVALELQHVASEENFTMTAASFRNSTCKQTSTVYALTSTPGRFFHHFAKFDADVDSFVIQTNYDEYALMLQQSTERPWGNTTTTAKLYSRTSNVAGPLLDDFKTLVRQHGMSDDSIIMNQNEGECVPGEQLTKPQSLVPKKPKRNVEPRVVPAQEEDAGNI